MGIELVLRDGIRVVDAAELINWYRSGAVRQGPTYYADWPVERSDRIEFGDLAWGVLLAGRPSGTSAQSLLERGTIDITSVPLDPLHELDQRGCQKVVDGIQDITRLPGFRSALATKILHPKRRASVPVLDNQAIYGALLDPNWRPGDRPKAAGTRERADIAAALEAIRRAVDRDENADAWQELEANYLPLQRIELFDMCWWALVRGRCDLASGGWRLKARADQRTAKA